MTAVPRLGLWDWVVALPVVAIALADAATTTEYDGGTPRLVLAAALQTLPLLVRRPLTVPAVAVSLLGVVVEVSGVQAYGGVYGLLAFLLLVHATSRWTTGVPRRASSALLAGGAVMHVLSQDRGPAGLVGAVVFVAVLSTVAWLLGRVSRAAEGREAEVAAEQARLLAEERARIARELHDVVGHALAGIALTAGAAERRAQDGSAEALGLIRAVSRDASADVRRLVGLLREDGDATGDDRAPRPTLDGVPALVEQAGRAGQRVALDPLPEVGDLPPGLQVAAYRIVQEALTNAAKHAPDAGVHVRVVREVGRLAVDVRTSGAAAAPEPGPAGHGLLGMGERARLYGGSLRAGPTGDGFEVEARFPL